MVNEYVTLYTKDQLQLVPQERPWGFTETAEVRLPLHFGDSFKTIPPKTRFGFVFGLVVLQERQWGFTETAEARLVLF